MTPTYRPPEQALRADLRTIADTNGWTLEEAESDHHGAGTVGRIAGLIAREEPSKYVGSAVGPEPDSVPRLYLKGKASAFARGLVDDADIPIQIIDDQPYSFGELEARATRVQEALLADGLVDVAVAVDITGAGRIPVRVRQTDETPSKATVRSMAPADLRDDVVIAIDDQGSWEPDHAGGGMKTTTTPRNGSAPAGGASRGLATTASSRRPIATMAST